MSSIEWTDETWNPTVGCSRVSKGCEHCYAEGVAHRGMSPQHRGLTVLGKHGKGPRWNGIVRFVESALAKPLSWTKPRRVFVNSMSDLFHESLPFEQIAAVFGVMAACPQHTFQVLTKRPERAAEFFLWYEGSSGAGASAFAAVYAARDHGVETGYPVVVAGEVIETAWPLRNVDIGVSVEDQATANERIPALLGMRESVGGALFVSYEPALGPVDLGLSSATCDCCPRWSSRWIRLRHEVRSDMPPSPLAFDEMVAAPGVYRAESNRHGALSVRDSNGLLLGVKPHEFDALPSLDWVIVGGESGPGARPFDLAWARSVIAQCRAAGVACFVKQLGALPVWSEEPPPPQWTARRADRKGGDMDEWPADLRVRQFPEVTR